MIQIVFTLYTVNEFTLLRTFDKTSPFLRSRHINKYVQLYVTLVLRNE